MRLFLFLAVAVQGYRESKRTYTPYGHHVATSGEFQNYQVSAGRSIHRSNTQRQYRFAPTEPSTRQRGSSNGRCKRGPRGLMGKTGPLGPKGDPGVCSPASCSNSNSVSYSNQQSPEDAGLKAAFSVTLSGAAFDDIGETVLFDTIVSDATNNYNSQEGTFTAASSGFYHFAAYGTQDDKNKPLHFSIKRGYLNRQFDDVLCSAQSNGSYQTSSCSTTVQLEKGQKVYVQLVKGDLFANRFHYTSFNGFQL
ncbi:Oidioi.mRNA.OKI2018_I69.chr2.g3984.t1.cds [Oikopleura dioica]|uniref:Oidioi.mRNA.OKI2018_I69.chr2.g3984.t1.cds n=1 Tax=Oikopleura dioica TaxID=34765 RepID=A0ABN7T041_OIKDI|nr:Oidioi.mRNA.OKI2018_I69.chr2.g3984.t1.cds [Oikopleura dioica]